MTSENASQPSPARQFDAAIKDMTDYGAYLRFLVSQGIPLLNKMGQHAETEADINQRYRLVIGLATTRVLENRTRAGLSNNPELLEHAYYETGMKEWIEEFVVDDTTKERFLTGLWMGLMAAGVIRKPWERHNNPADPQV